MYRFVKPLLTLALLAYPLLSIAEEPKSADKPKVAIGEKAPEFKIKGPDGKIIDLAELTAKGPVLVRLTCGCSGCDKELSYFQEVSAAYKDLGLISLYIFKEPDDKVAKYVKDKKLNLLYAVDSKGDSWNVFQTKTMPTNFLIEKGGKIVAIANGCDASGIIAQKVGDKAAKIVDTKPVDVKGKVEDKKKEEK
ncbi:MAG: redoxin domain-containing protein [Gemmataceae bacterium]|nr:redoxin domain-containing protein [Gemmataceae bacterium]